MMNKHKSQLKDKRIIRENGGRDERFVAVIQVVEGTGAEEVVLEEERMVVHLDALDVDTAKIQKMIDSRKEALERRVANRKRVDLDSLT